jgi:hypothetical protein
MIHRDFREWALTEKLNPLMYDLETEEGRRQYEDDLAWFKELQSRPTPKEVKRENRKEPLVLTCWTGMSPEHLDRLTVESGRNSRVLDPEKSRSRAIWFTHQHITGGKEYAQNHNDGILITYPLETTAYYDVVTYDDGNVQEEPNQELSDEVDPRVESPWRILGKKVVGVPEGWTFSDNGFLLRELPLPITENMISRH